MDGRSIRSPGRRMAAWTTLLVVLAFVGSLSLAQVVSSATLTNAWQANIGSGGVNGTAKMQAFDGGTGSLTLRLAKLRPATLVPVTLYKGTCSSVGPVLFKVASIKTSSAGAAARTSSLSASQVTLIKNATAGGGRIAIRVGSSTTGGVKCGVFTVLAIPPYVAARVTVGIYPRGVVVAPNGVWVTSWNDNSLSRIDPTTNAVLQTLPLTISGNGGPDRIAFGEGSLWVPVTEFDANNKSLPGSLLRIDPASGTQQATIPIGRNAAGLAVSPGAVWVALYDDNAVVRVDSATNAVAATIPVTGNPVGVAFGAGSVWVSADDGHVARIDPATNQIVATVQTQDTGGFVAFGGNAVWVTNAGHVDQPDGMVSRIDPVTNQVVASVTVGSYPQDIAYGGGSLWVGLFDAPTVVRVNAATNAVLARIALAAPIQSLAATDRSVWAVHVTQAPDANTAPTAGTVTRIDYSGITQGPMQGAAPSPAAPVVSPTPTPVTPAPTPAPIPTPAAGSTLVVGTGFTFTLPAGWTPVPSDDPSLVMFQGPANQMIGASSGQTSLALDAVTAGFVASMKAQTGADPEQTEAISIGGAPGTMLTYHFALSGANVYSLVALCVHNGTGYEVMFVGPPGNEGADRTLFLSVVASFAFTIG